MLPRWLGAEERCQHQAGTGRRLIRVANWWSSSIYGGLFLYVQPCSVLCPTFAEPLPSFSVGEGEAVQVVAFPTTGRVMWLKVGRVALHGPSWSHYIIPAEPGRCLGAGRGGGHESRSGAQAAMQGECASQAAERRRGVEPGSSSERMLWTWDYVATTMDFPPFHKGGQNDQSFRQQSTILVRLLKRSMLDWKAKRLKMGGCNKHEDWEQEGPSMKFCWPTARKPSICESNRCVTHTWW